MTRAIVLNGRFLTQPVTGVQRYAAEITLAIDRLVARGDWPEVEVVAPCNLQTCAVGARLTTYEHLKVRCVGRTRGHVWEQTELAMAARGGVLVSLGNTGPVAAGRRQVVVIHDAAVFDTPASYSAPFRLWYRTLHRGLVAAGARVATVSRFSRGRIAAHLGLDPARIAVTYEGSDHVLRVAADPATLGRHGLERHRFALVVGTHGTHKNLEGLVELAAALATRGMILAVAGGASSGVFAAPTPSAASIGRALGRVTDGELRALYESAACLLFPSRYEGFGLPPIEALACGCPVMAARGAAVEEICGDTALYFDPRDGRSLINASRRLFDDGNFADELSVRGRVRAAAFTWEAAAGELGRVVHSLQ
jgi:glycosyltransferase involved in cell wall biosynthesis